MDCDTGQKIRAQLSPGESLVWSGRPRRGIVIRGSDALLIPFSLLWAGFAFYWEYTAYSSGAPLFFLVFGGFFVIMGLHLVFGRFISDALVRGSTYYGVTNERILILTEFPSSTSKSLALANLSDIGLTSKPDGSGSITFGPQHPAAAMMGGAHWPGMGKHRSPSFDLIPDAKSVFDKIQQTQRRLR
jgi:hypothetical protein